MTWLCAKCSGLSSTEQRAVVLSCRSLIYWCDDCKSKSGSSNREEIAIPEIGPFGEQISELFGEQLTMFARTFGRDILDAVRREIGPVLGELTSLRDTNIELREFVNAARSNDRVPGSVAGAFPVTTDREQSPSSQLTEATTAPTGSDGMPPVCSNVRSQPGSTGASHRDEVRGAAPPLGPSSLSASGRQVSGGSGMLGGSNGPPGVVGRAPIIGSRRSGAARISAATLRKRTSILVSRLEIGVTAEDLKSYLLDTFAPEDSFSIEEQKVRTGDYKSFRVEASLDCLDALLTASNWPDGVFVKKFRFFRRRQIAESK